MNLEHGFPKAAERRRSVKPRPSPPAFLKTAGRHGYWPSDKADETFPRRPETRRATHLEAEAAEELCVNESELVRNRRRSESLCSAFRICFRRKTGSKRSVFWRSLYEQTGRGFSPSVVTLRGSVLVYRRFLSHDFPNLLPF